MVTNILAALAPTITDVENWKFFLKLMGGVVLAFGVLAFVLTKIEDRIQRELTDQEPTVDDVAERRRLSLIVGGRPR